ncbi:MAG: exostosin domain-containing protein [Pseudomarimonas sp.]
MKIFAHSLGSVQAHRDQLALLQSAAAMDKFGRHSLVEDPGQAEVILEIDQGSATSETAVPLTGFKLPIFRYSTRDNGFPYRPGIYTSLQRYNFNSAFARSGPYLAVTRQTDLDLITEADERKQVASFFGSSETHKVRKKLLMLAGEHCVIRDTAPDLNALNTGHSFTNQEYRRQFLQSISSSQFVLCPRGLGCSSIRLFEVMRAGRTPVIISDNWVPPLGPNWSSFAIFAGESEVESILSRLRSLEQQAPSMGLAARAAWLANFGVSTVFDWIASQISEMVTEQRQTGKSFLRWKTGRMADPRNFNKAIVPILKRPVHKIFARRNQT